MYEFAIIIFTLNIKQQKNCLETKYDNRVLYAKPEVRNTNNETFLNIHLFRLSPKNVFP